MNGVFSYNLMAVSRADLARLREMHIAYFRDMQSLVADSAPSECVVLFNADLFALDDSSKRSFARARVSGEDERNSRLPD